MMIMKPTVLLVSCLVPALSSLGPPASAAARNSEFGVLQPGDVKIVESCLTQATSARSESAASRCIGTVAASCLETSNKPAAQLRMADCNWREEAAWDHLLNEGYKAALVMAQKRDEDFAHVLASPTALKSLREAQRAWIQFRDAECGRIDAYFEGTGGRLDQSSRCSLNLTAERVVVIQDFLKFATD